MGNVAQLAPAGATRTGTAPSWSGLKLWQGAVLLGLSAWLYAPIMGRLAQQWWTDPNFSHGFFVPAFAAFVVWQEWKRLIALPRSSSL
jgi:hypothetical protein